MSWISFLGSWPETDVGLPAVPANLNFSLKSDARPGQTLIKFSVFDNAAGYGTSLTNITVAVASSPTANIIGRIIGSSGNGIGNTLVQTDWAGATTYSLENGYFILTGPAGIHKITVTHSGYKQLIWENVEVQSGAETDLGDLTLLAVTPPIERGDINGDMKVDVTDAILAIKQCVGSIPSVK